MLRRTAIIASVAAALLLLVPHAANAGSNSNQASSTLKTITVAVSVSDESSCGEFWTGIQNWQCTPVLVASATPQQPVSTGGSVSWTATATCTYRKKADGFTSGWSAWTSCGPSTKWSSGSRSWALGAAPTGGITQITWPQIQNAETLGYEDCVEIAVSIAISATGRSAAESVNVSTRFPSNPAWTAGHSICEA